jgi:hypothetical protein
MPSSQGVHHTSLGGMARYSHRHRVENPRLRLYVGAGEGGCDL